MRTREEWHPVLYFAGELGPGAKAYPVKLKGCLSRDEAFERAKAALVSDPRVVCVSVRRAPADG